MERSLFDTKEFLTNLHYAKIYLAAKLSIDQDVIAVGVANEIRQNLRNKNPTITAFYLDLIVYLNFEKTGYTKDCIYITGDREVCEKTYTLAQLFTDECKKCLLKCLHLVLKGVFMSHFHGFLENEETRLPALLVLRYYPCIVFELCPVEKTIDYFLDFNIYDSEECITAVIGCIDVVLRRCHLDTLRKMQLGRFFKFFYEPMTSTSSATHIRLATAHLLLYNKSLYILADFYANCM